MPRGAPISTPMTVITTLPKMALSRPPSLPGGGVISVNTAPDRPPMPFHSRLARISRSAPRPSAAAPTHSDSHTALRRRRAACMDRAVAVMAQAPLRRSSRISMRRAAASTTKVITNRISPSAISDEV